MNDLTVIGLSTTGAAGIVSAAIAALTMAYPERPRWLPVLLAVALGFGVQAMILFRIDNLVTPNLWIDSFLLGIPAGLGAIGINSANHSGDQARYEAQADRMALADVERPSDQRPKV
jgi:hypothetical protein